MRGMIRTFAALATPPGEGGIHVVLLAGERAGPVLEAAFRSARNANHPDPPSLSYGHVLDGDEILDEVLVARREDGTFEINTHGGPAAAEAVLRRLEDLGARRLAPPRFRARFPGPHRSPGTRRASHLLARASTPLAVSVLAEQAAGALDRALEELARRLAGPPGPARSACRELLATAPLGRALARPPAVVLCGPENAGKSTLFNRLAGRERAIVHETPGTTRDRLRETVDAFGVPLEISDSPGLGASPASSLQEAGRNASKDHARRADLRIFLFHGNRDPSPADLEDFASLPSPRLAAVGKADLAASSDVARRVGERTGREPSSVSGRTGAGVASLLERMLEALEIERPPDAGPAGPVLCGGRGERLVREAWEALGAGDRRTLPVIARGLMRRAGRASGG